MRHATVSKKELLAALVKNRADHMRSYKLALDGFYKEAVDKYKEALTAAEGRTDLPHIHLVEPDCHMEDYDRAIGMLKMHVEQTVDITEEEYAHFVDDDWDWKQSWRLMNNVYMTRAAGK